MGKAVAIRDKAWTFVHRLHEPPELCSRKEDPREPHDLVEAAESAEVRRRTEAGVLRWMVESSDFLPYQQNTRFPRLSWRILDPKTQWEKRGP